MKHFHFTDSDKWSYSKNNLCNGELTDNRPIQAMVNNKKLTHEQEILHCPLVKNTGISLEMHQYCALSFYKVQLLYWDPIVLVHCMTNVHAVSSIPIAPQPNQPPPTQSHIPHLCEPQILSHTGSEAHHPYPARLSVSLSITNPIMRSCLFKSTKIACETTCVREFLWINTEY